MIHDDDVIAFLGNDTVPSASTVHELGVQASATDSNQTSNLSEDLSMSTSVDYSMSVS